MQNIWSKEWFRFVRFYKYPKQFFLNIKYSFQRITKGYCDRDLWNIDDWFTILMPKMLKQFKETRNGSPVFSGEHYVDENGILCNTTCHEEWDKILDEMIFYFTEMNEDTCSKKNPYSEEISKINYEFNEKYGLLGEKLRTEEEKSSSEYKRVYFPSDLPEYAEIFKKYDEEQEKIYDYMKDCQNKALELFCKYFNSLWY